MSRKIADVEQDIAQYKVEAGEKFAQLEQGMAAIREETKQGMEAIREEARQRHTETEKKHSELMAMLMKIANPPPPLTPPVSAALQPPPPQPSLPPPLLPISAASTSTYRPPTVSSGPITTGPIPVTGHAPLLLGSDVFSTTENGSRFIRGKYHVTTGYDTGYVGSGPMEISGAPPWANGSGPQGDRIWAPGSDYGAPPWANGSGFHRDRMWVPGADYRLRKLKMPLFDGTDAYGWVSRAERFFDIQGLGTSAERMRAAVICLEGQALAWYQWIDRREPFRGWEHLKYKLLARFQSSQEGTLHEQLIAVNQKGTAREYVNQFEILAAQLEGIPEQILEGAFIKGLKPELREAVRVLQPTGVGQAIQLALMIDESRSSPDQGAAPKVPTPPPPKTYEPEPTTTEFRKMTETEYAEKRAKGLCFRCDAKYTPGHRCQAKRLQVLMIDEKEIEEPEHAHFD